MNPTDPKPEEKVAAKPEAELTEEELSKVAGGVIAVSHEVAGTKPTLGTVNQHQVEE